MLRNNRQLAEVQIISDTPNTKSLQNSSASGLWYFNKSDRFFITYYQTIHFLKRNWEFSDVLPEYKIENPIGLKVFYKLNGYETRLGINP